MINAKVRKNKIFNVQIMILQQGKWKHLLEFARGTPF